MLETIRIGNLNVFECSQGSVEWFQARAGRPTASNFNKIVSSSGLSKQADGYANMLVAERILGESVDLRSPTQSEERGTVMELEAADAYEALYKTPLMRCGFCVDDNGTAGCSLDRIVCDQHNEPIGGLEIKCQSAVVHMNRYFKGDIDNEHIPQVQGQIFVTGLPWIDIFHYYPGLPSFRYRIKPNPLWQNWIAQAMPAFLKKIDDKMKILAEEGLI